MKLYEQLGDNPFPKDNDNLNDTWKKIINDSNYHIVVCIEDEKIVSSCTLVIIPNLTHNVRPYAFVFKIQRVLINLRNSFFF